MKNHYCGHCDSVTGCVTSSTYGSLICSSRKHGNIIIGIYNIDRHGGRCATPLYSICLSYKDLKEKNIQVLITEYNTSTSLRYCKRIIFGVYNIWQKLVF